MEGMRLLYALACLAAVACAQSSTPVVSSVTPNPIDAGGPTFTLTVSLGAFVSPAVVKWSGTPLVTGYVDDYTLSAIVPAGLIAICGKYFVTVTNTQSNAVSDPYAVIVKPVLKSLSPNLVPAGSPGGTVTATGLGFSSNVYLTLIASGSQSSLATGYGGPTTLTAFIPTSALSGNYATVDLFVTDPGTGAVSQKLSITLTFASVSVISPNTIVADIASYMPAPGGTSFSLAVGGANFAPGAQVFFDGTALTTSYNASTYLTATVPAALVHYAGADNKSNRLAGITVKNPGAAASNSINFNILPNPFGSTIISVAPAAALAGAPTSTLTVTGERYVQGSTVMWILTPLVTTLVSSTQLTATVPAKLVAVEGTVPMYVSTPGVADSNSITYPIVAAAPTVSSISPTSAVAGGPGFTMTVNGDSFIPTSQVIGLDSATTTYVSVNQLTVSVPPGAIAKAGSHVIQVVNPGSLVSPQAPIFTVKAATPAITSLSPASVLVGGPDFTLTVNGSNFLSSTTVAWNGAALPTTRVSATQVTALVSAALIAAPGSAKISVFNDGPVSSNELVLSISTTPAASLASLSPSAAAPGGAAFTLTVTGAGFTANSRVQWNGVPLATTLVSASQLTASVPAALIATAGTASVTVAGDGATSNALAFTIALLTPTVTFKGILNSASFLPSIAPGTLITIFGSNLAAALAQAPATPLPVSLGGSSVTINGTAIPLLFVSPEQINAQVPYETKVGTAKLVVTSNGVSSPAVNFEVAATGPGVFTPPQDSTHVLAVNLSDGALNASQTPARPGQYVTAYLTGQGQVDPPVTTGDVAPSSPPFPVPVGPVQVKIGGVAATIQFAGMAPGLLVMQMNILIPDVPAGEQSFDVSIGGVAAASAVISIGPKQ